MLLSISCEIKYPDLISTKDLQKVEVQYVDFRITTPNSVKCNELQNYFGESQIRSKIFDKTYQWDSLIEQLNRVIRKDEKFNDPADVRMQIYLHYSTNVRSICIGRTLISMGEKNYVSDDLFREFMSINFEE